VIDNNIPSPVAGSADLYTDLSALQKLKAQGGDKNAQLREIAHQFESMMVQMMMKSMREANAVFSEGDPLSSNDSKFYQDMFDNQLSLNLTKGQGMGLAAAMLRQMQGKYGNAATAETQAAVSHDLETLKQHRMAIAPDSTGENFAADADAIQAAFQKLFGDAAQLQGTSAADQAAQHFDGSPDAFVEALYPHAEQAAQQLGIDSRVLLSQAALETGWGQKVLQHADGSSSFNFFNIKADANWQGAVVKVPAVEYRDGVAVREVSTFRAYATPAESFADYAKLIGENPRYQDALQRVDNPRAYVHALADAGYATDPRYAEKVLAVMDSNDWRASADNSSAL
jgi:peptidoglycan hydrolase FlgJ